MRLKHSLFIVLIVSFCLNACKTNTQPKDMTDKKYSFDLQGHRGARGLLPENTLLAFQKAIDIGVNTLELDVVISKDSLVVVSHEAYMNPKICLDATGNKISNKKAFNLYEMNYKEIKAFDCGSLPHPDFPNQKQEKSYKPLLTEVIKLVETNSTAGKFVNLNIELKSSRQTDGVYHPEPNVFVNLVIETILKESFPLEKVSLQSFDVHILRYIIDNYPDIAVAYLVEDGQLENNLETLGRIPHIYSPNYKSLDSLQIQKAHDKEIKIIPWTVNDKNDMQELLSIGVDGIITDYPNMAKAFQ